MRYRVTPDRTYRRVLTCLTLTLASAWLTGCAGFKPQPGPGPEPVANYTWLTAPVLAVGDTQEHESTGFPMHDNDSAVDAYVEVAQRPPEQPLFGRRILEWALQRHPNEPYLHLGDVMDLSCRSEAERMSAIFEAAGRPGAILPGNHDGLMFGIYGYNLFDRLDPDARRWNEACRRGAAPEDASRRTGSEALGKREFIVRYLKEQATRIGPQGPWPKDSERGGSHLSWRNPNPAAFVSAIEANLLEGVTFADSFIAQRLRMPAAAGAARAVIVIALDTNQAGPLVSAWDTVMGRSPGSAGHVHPDQLRAIQPWVEEAIRAGDIVILAGHHNWQSLGLPTRLLLSNLMAKLEHPLVYLSAHTHRGFWAVHRTLDRRSLLELNVSSLSDWPIAYRRISFAYDDKAQRLLVRGELVPNAGRAVNSDADLLDAWSTEVCAQIGPEPDAFVRFDNALVNRQRDERGSLIEWLVSSLAPVCAECAAPMYRHAQAYQDTLLETILQVASHLGQRAHHLYDVALPAWCGDTDFYDCARALQAQVRTDFAGHVELFRRKAALVYLMGTHLDGLRSPQAAAYMTCRAVHAAKVDHELSVDARAAHRNEANRRAEQFFRIEASIGRD